MNVAQLHPAKPVARGLMVVYGNTAAVIGEPGQLHRDFFAQVKYWALQHVQAGSPRSGGMRGEQYDL